MNIDERLEALEAVFGSKQTMLVHGAEGWGLIFDAGEQLSIPISKKTFFARTVHEVVLMAEETSLQYGKQGLMAGLS